MRFIEVLTEHWLFTQETLKVHASSVASQPVAAPAASKAGEGYEVAPFSSDVRWKTDRSLRKLSAGATGTVYRSVFSAHLQYQACQCNLQHG